MHIQILLLAGLLFSPAPDFAQASDGTSLDANSILDSSGGTDFDCGLRTCENEVAVEKARGYLIETARPGGTMVRQGPVLSIERLHPEFATRLAEAIREARSAGLAEAGIFSAYRPPAFGVGGFADKYYSLHAYGLAVDMYGIGRPGSAEAQLWHEIAARHGIVCPYGYRNRLEWNHCQPTHLEAVKSHNPLRDTISGSGPVDLERMFEAGNDFIADVATTLDAVVEHRSILAVVEHRSVSQVIDRATSRFRLAGHSGRREQITQRFSINSILRRKAARPGTRDNRLLSKPIPTSRTRVAMMWKKVK
jgi:hypothetical protein